MVEQRHAAALVAFKGLVLISHYEPPIRHSEKAISNRKPDCRQRTLIGSIATPEPVDLPNSALATIYMDPAKPPEVPMGTDQAGFTHISHRQSSCQECAVIAKRQPNCRAADRLATIFNVENQTFSA